MRVVLGAGWQLTHVTDRVIELRKECAIYRRFTGRDGYVRFRGEPGMDRQALIEGAVTIAKANDERMSQLVAKRLMPTQDRVARYHIRQQHLSRTFGTPEEPEIIGVKRP